MNRKRIVSLVILFCLVIAALVALLVYRSTIFRMTGTEPGLGRVSVISPFIDIKFSKPLNVDKTALRSETTPITTFKVVNGNTLRLFLEDLDLGKQNIIILENIASKSGKELKNIEIKFTAQDIPFNEMSRAQQQAILDQQDAPSEIRDDPILSHLPHGDLSFNLEAVVKDEEVTLEAELLLSAADVRLGSASAVERYKKEVQDYIRSIGLNPADYKINYKVTQPTL